MIEPLLEVIPTITIPICFLILFLVYSLLWRVSPVSQEPPVLRSKLPLIGHFLSLLKFKYQYHVNNHKKYNLSAYTLPILGGKLYVASSPQLAASVFEKRTLSFEPLIDSFVRTLVGLDGQGMQLWTDPEFRTAIFRVLYRGLGGQSLADLTTGAVSKAANYFNELPPGQLEVVDFYVWIRKVVATNVMGGFYGDLSPFSDPRVLQSFWTYHDEMHKLLPGIAPSLVAANAYGARTEVIKALETYIRKENDFGDDVPQFTRDRFSAERKFGMSIHDSAKIEVLLATALANVPTLTYWLITHVYNQPELLARIREELLGAVVQDDSTSATELQMTLRLGGIKDRCPLLSSCLQETQRHNIVDSITRTVMKDTAVSDGGRSYLLKAGNSVQMPLSVLHANPNVWGDDADDWVGERSLKLGYMSSPPPGFHPFGGGKHIW
ncbi:prostacyclin synthase [Colletotrichum tabaci]|uniref:Prostacyclin synthase n=1 Tax=Colletotrichum tabaci TaxID=1209068 RepID=A0AAV9SWH9_9PEZI